MEVWSTFVLTDEGTMFLIKSRSATSAVIELRPARFGLRHHSLSNMATEMVLRRMKIEDATVHGFRSSFRDWQGTSLISTARWWIQHWRMSSAIGRSRLPEISTWTMLLLGFGGLGFLAYRCRNQSALIAT
jgi:hypothetical protein